MTINNEESPLVSMQQRPLIVPATLHFSGLPQKSSIYTQEAITGKIINLTLFFPWPNIFFLFQPGAPVSATSLCIVFILPGISVYLREFFSFFFSAPTLSLSFLTVHLPLACVQTPPPPPVPSGKIGEGPASPIFPERGGVYTQPRG